MTHALKFLERLLPLLKPRVKVRTDLRRRNGILACEKEICRVGGIKGDAAYEIPGAGLAHEFGDGIYVRECTLPAGMLLTSKIHKTSHPYFILSGRGRVLTEEGVKEIVGPCHGITPAGTKRLIYVIEDMVWCTAHATKHKDLKKIENQIIAEDYSDFRISDEDKKLIMEGVR